MNITILSLDLSSFKARRFRRLWRGMELKWRLANICNNDKEVCVSIGLANHDFRVTIIMINLSKWLKSSIWSIDGILTGTTRVDLRVLAMKRYSTFSKAPGLGTYHQMQYNAILRTVVFFGGGGALTSADVQSAYSTAQADWV